MESKKPLPPVSTLKFNEESSFWLVKIPGFLADAWTHAERGTELGEVSFIHKDSSPDPIVEMTARPLKGINPSSPLDFSCNYSKQISNEIKIFSEDVPGNITFEGLVNIKVDCTAKDSVLLGKSLNQRALAIQKSETHDLQVFEEKDIDTYVAKNASFTNNLTSKYQKPKKKKGEKRERMEETKLQELIFAAFYVKPLLTLAELDRQLEQPVQYLKEVLNKICIYHTSGKNRLHFEIKDEFKSKKMRLEVEAMQQDGNNNNNNNNNFKPKVEVKFNMDDNENFED